LIETSVQESFVFHYAQVAFSPDVVSQRISTSSTTHRSNTQYLFVDLARRFLRSVAACLGGLLKVGVNEIRHSVVVGSAANTGTGPTAATYVIKMCSPTPVDVNVPQSCHAGRHAALKLKSHVSHVTTRAHFTRTGERAINCCTFS
jgi:hypothetical protein